MKSFSIASPPKRAADVPFVVATHRRPGNGPTQSTHASGGEAKQSHTQRGASLKAEAAANGPRCEAERLLLRLSRYLSVRFHEKVPSGQPRLTLRVQSNASYLPH